MKQKIYSFLNEPKTKIGWVHGIFTIIFSVVLAYLTAMLFSSLDFEDYAIKIIPAMIMTPILICFFGIYLLNSITLFMMLKKFFILFFVLMILLFIGF